MTFVTCGRVPVSCSNLNMSGTGTKQAVERRQRFGDRRKVSATGRRANDLQPGQELQLERSSDIMVLASALLLAPRLQAFEFKDSLAIRKLIGDAVTIAKILMQKVDVEQARDTVAKNVPGQRTDE